MGAPVPLNSAARRGRRGWSLLAVLAGATVPVVAACGTTPTASPPPNPAPATTRVAPPATSAVPATTAATAAVPVDDEAQVRAVIDTYWQEWTIAMAEADPARPALLATLDGDARDRIVAQLRTSAALGQVSVRPEPLPVPHETLAVNVVGQEATVRECVTDDTTTIDRTTNSVLNSLVHRFVLQKSLVRSEATWRIVDSTIVTEIEGSQACTDV